MSSKPGAGHGDQRSSEAFANAKNVAREPTACVVLACHAARLPGPPPLHRVGRTPDVLQFYREAPEIGDFDHESYIQNAERSFPTLYFKPGISAEIRRFSQAFRVIRPTLTRALTGLDEALPVVRREHPNTRELPTAFSTRTGFEISPESPKTHKNRAAMARREVVIDGIAIVCEWHLKMSPQIDRIHFHFGDHRIGGGRTIVGIFCDHLPI